MRRLLLTICLMIGMTSVWGQASLLIWSNDGTKLASYMLESQPKVYFTSDQVVVESEHVSVAYELADVSYFSFEGVISDHIVNLFSDDKTPFIYDGESIIFPSGSGKLHVMVCTADGRIMVAKETTNHQSMVLPLSSLAGGVYLVKVNGITCKVLKK